MDHLLNNPVWNALAGENKTLAEGNDLVKCFPVAIAPFVGLRQIDPESFDALYQLIPAGRTIAILTPDYIDIPAEWKPVHHTQLLQMVMESKERPPAGSFTIQHLGQLHVPAMLTLTKMTNPGPFYERTIEFGNYSGIFSQDQLVAMAGQRLHAGQYIEISAVCTQPDYAGRGFGKALVLHLVQLIRQQGCIPFLHVRKDNTNAIKLYSFLGFLTRHEMTINIVRKNE